MTPTQALLDAVAAAIAADTAALAAAGFLHVYPVKQAFSPGIGLVVADVPKADFDGGTPKVTSSATILTGIDPQTGEWILEIPEIAGGWRWEVSGTTNLPQTIHGFALTNVGESTLWGTALLDAPVVLTAVSQVVEVGSVAFRLSNAALS